MASSFLDVQNKTVIFYGYWRSSTSYRLRIGLNLKGIDYEYRPLNMLKSEQSNADYVAQLNPMAAVPTLVIGGQVLVQSLAILEFLDDFSKVPTFTPLDPFVRAQARATAQIIACDIHPVVNLSPLRYLKEQLGHDPAAVDAWYRHWVERGLRAVERRVARDRAPGDYCHGDTITLADICLVPQMYNARRYKVDLAQFPTLQEIDLRLLQIPSFAAARPENQIDATDRT